MDKYSLTTGLREQTIMKDVYFTPPFNLVEVREIKKNPLLEVMVMSSSPGLLNDDSYSINIEVIDGSALNLQSQAYQRIFVSELGTTQSMNVRVGHDAYFSHTPHPTVPHKGARYTARNTIHLENSSTLLWGDILTCGRKHMGDGERFQFKKHHTITEIFRDGVLVFKDSLYLVPDEIDVNQFGQYEGRTHQGSLFFTAPNIDVEEKMREVTERLSSEADIDFGITKVLDDAYLFRVLGNEGEQILRLFTEIRQAEDSCINEKGYTPCSQS